MPSLDLHVSNTLKLLGDPGSRMLAQACVKASHKHGSLLRGAVVDKITAMRKVDRGDLRKSLTYNVRRHGSRISMTLGTNMSYAIFVHEGTKPHWTPMGPLLAWAKRKLPELTDSQALQFARGVRLKISRVGTKANPFLTEVMEEKGPSTLLALQADTIKNFRAMLGDQK